MCSTSPFLNQRVSRNALPLPASAPLAAGRDDPVVGLSTAPVAAGDAATAEPAAWEASTLGSDGGAAGVLGIELGVVIDPLAVEAAGEAPLGPEGVDPVT